MPTVSQLLRVFVLGFYAFAFLRERWKAFRSRSWILTQGTFLSDTVEADSKRPAWATARVNYKYSVNGTEFLGTFSRFFAFKFTADEWINQLESTPVPVRYDPANPEVSFAAFSRPFGGYFAPITASIMVLLACGSLMYDFFDPDRSATHAKLQASLWRPLDVPGAFHIQVPGNPTPTSRFLGQTVIREARPAGEAWVISSGAGYFYAAVLRYPANIAIGSDVLEHLPAAIHQQTGDRNASPVRSLRLDRGSGLEFKLTHPNSFLRAYANGNKLYIFETDWDVPSDVKAFFNSLRIE